MAGALRPVVVLMALASLLFVVDGWLDGAYPGGEGWIGGPAHHGIGPLSYVFAVVNGAVALLIARGSERTLLARIALSAFFLVERPLTAFLLGPKSAAAVGVHLATALVELGILLGAIGVWRLGRSVAEPDLDVVLALDAPGPPPRDPDDVLVSGLPQRSAWKIVLLALLLAATLVADGVAAGFLPGGRQWGTDGDTSGWLVYVFAAVAVVAALPAIQGGTLALRVLLALTLILFLERAFSPFATRVFEPINLTLHVIGAFIALALALAAAAALADAARRTRPRPPASLGRA